MDRLREKIEALTYANGQMQEKHAAATSHLLEVLAERDSARTQLKISEKTSAQRLLLIQREVPNYARSFLNGTFDWYRASL